jgi:beta-lactamase superfamily II metal-dependent hydrolase
MLRLLFLLALVPLSVSAADKLSIYWIDVEGGASTLIVTAAGETVLMDAGFGGFGDRDPKRIHHVLTHEAKATKIDHFITSHFHGDHVGGLEALAKMVPIGRFIDHGDSVDKDRENARAMWAAYLALTKGKRHSVTPGEKIALTGAELTFVASDGKRIEKPIGAGAANPLCANAKVQDEDRGENGRSVGFMVRVGDFEFLNLGDLSWNSQHNLACPLNLLGEVDLMQTPHHAVRDDIAPQLMSALKPAVVVMNNGPRKGGGADSYETASRSPGLADLWQLHRSLENDDAHNTAEARIANTTDTDGCEGHWIRAILRDDGSYTVFNSRNGQSTNYQAR